MTNFKTPIVLDTGSGLMKAGFADQDLPNTIFPNIIGLPKYEVRQQPSMWHLYSWAVLFFIKLQSVVLATMAFPMCRLSNLPSGNNEWLLGTGDLYWT